MGRCTAKFQVNGSTLYPFSVECAAVEHFDVSIAGCLTQDDGYTLALPTKSKATKTEGFNPQLPLPRRIIQLRNLPLDIRHNAKIDYVRLRKLCR